MPILSEAITMCPKLLSIATRNSSLCHSINVTFHFDMLKCTIYLLHMSDIVNTSQPKNLGQFISDYLGSSSWHKFLISFLLIQYSQWHCSFFQKFWIHPNKLYLQILALSPQFKKRCSGNVDTCWKLIPCHFVILFRLLSL